MKTTYPLLSLLILLTGCLKEKEEPKSYTFNVKAGEPLTILVTNAAAATITFPEEDPEAWGYRLVTDGKLFKIQHKWAPNYWGDCLGFGGPFQTKAEADKALAEKRKAAKEYAEEHSREWKPVTN